LYDLCTLLRPHIAKHAFRQEERRKFRIEKGEEVPGQGSGRGCAEVEWEERVEWGGKGCAAAGDVERFHDGPWGGGVGRGGEE